MAGNDRASSDGNIKIWPWEALVVLLLMAGFAFAVIAAYNGLAAEAGQFGDSFGWINSVASSVAAIFAVYAVLLQRSSAAATRDSDHRQARIQSVLAFKADCESSLLRLTSEKQQWLERIDQLLADQSYPPTAIDRLKVGHARTSLKKNEVEVWDTMRKIEYYRGRLKKITPDSDDIAPEIPLEYKEHAMEESIAGEEPDEPDYGEWE